MKSTHAVLDHHLQSLGSGDVNAVIADYTEDSVLLTANGPIKGTKALDAFFRGFLSAMPEFMAGFRMVRQEVLGDIAYIVWESPKYAPLGTDTFLIRGGKILTQTFAAHMLR
jgi:ketosteroid isomerase-like protein